MLCDCASDRVPVYTSTYLSAEKERTRERGGSEDIAHIVTNFIVGLDLSSDTESLVISLL